MMADLPPAVGSPSPLDLPPVPLVPPTSVSHATTQSHNHQFNHSTNMDPHHLHGIHTHVGPHGEIYNDDPPMHPLAAVLLLYGTMFLMVGGQMALVLWKKKHKKSYELVTLVGLWLMPAFFSFMLHFWRFLSIWALYTACTIYILSQCWQKKLTATMPRMVYGYFITIYKVSRTIGIVGYVMLLMEIMGAGPLFAMFLPKGTSLDLVWYGVYFGVLGRDCAEVATDGMTSSMGTGKQLVSRVNNCGICGNELEDNSHMGVHDQKVEAAVQLSCKHCFHDLCIRGWTMVGKKDICPLCHEKVDMRELYADRPWETRNLTWIQMLDGVRYLVVWNPIIFMALSLLFHFLAPHHHPHVPHDNATLYHGPPVGPLAAAQ